MSERSFQKRVTNVYIQRISIHTGGLQLFERWGRGCAVIVYTKTFIWFDFISIACPWNKVHKIIMNNSISCQILFFKLVKINRSANRNIMLFLIEPETYSWCILCTVEYKEIAQ